MIVRFDCYQCGVVFEEDHPAEEDCPEGLLRKLCPACHKAALDRFNVVHPVGGQSEGFPSLKTELHVFSLAHEETFEQLARLEGELASDAVVARSKISATTELIQPVDRVAHQVAARKDAPGQSGQKPPHGAMPGPT